MTAPSPDETPPPFGGRWSRLYLIVAVWLGLCIALGYALTRWAR